MKNFKQSLSIIALFLFLFTSCSSDDKDMAEDTVKDDPKIEDPVKEETLADKFLGTYECVMTKVEREGVVKGENLGLYCFVTPSLDNAEDKVTIEVRNWSGNFMPHLLSFKAEVALEKDSDGKYTMKFPENAVIPYEVQGLKGDDKEGTVTGTFSLDKDNVPSFDCTFFVFKYTMKINTVKFKTKTVLPNANSSL